MKGPSEKLHEQIKALSVTYALEFDMTLYETVGVLQCVANEIWYEHDKPEEDEEEEDDL